MVKPLLKEHNGIYVVRDDLFPGGTKARYLQFLFEQYDEIVYATPAEGGAQTALAHCARKAGKQATLFVAKRQQPHNRALEAKAVGAKVYQVKPGYLTVVQKRARQYCDDTGAYYLPFGANLEAAINKIAEAARSLEFQPDEVWCASGSGVLMRGLARAWPNASRHSVQVGRALTDKEVAGAIIHKHDLKYEQECKTKPPFPSDPHYDAKAWELCQLLRKGGRTKVLFWNVTGPANPNIEIG